VQVAARGPANTSSENLQMSKHVNRKVRRKHVFE